MRYRISLLVFLLLFSFKLVAQQLKVEEKLLQTNFLALRNTTSDSLKLDICKKIEQNLLQILKYEKSFNYPFNLLKTMGKYRAEDNRFRIYNWNCQLSDGTYRYFGIVQSKYKKQLKIEVLTDSENPDMFKANSAKNWAGAIYYKIIPFKKRGGNAYVLLGWDGNNLSTSKKLIELLSFDRTGAVKFGLPIIKWRNRRLYRVVFEYAKQAKINIIYQAKKNRLVFDHLAPVSPEYENQFDYYGPDFSFDALELKKGIWQLKENINPQK